MLPIFLMQIRQFIKNEYIRHIFRGFELAKWIFPSSRYKTQTWVATVKKDCQLYCTTIQPLHTCTPLLSWLTGLKDFKQAYCGLTTYCFCIDWVVDIAIMPPMSLKSNANMVPHNDFSRCFLN